MYQFPGKLKSIALALIVIGALGIGYGFFTSSSLTIEDAKQTIEHQEELAAKKAEEAKLDPRAIQYGSHAEKHEATHETAHDPKAAEKHEEHVLTQLKNRPWSAFYVSLFFFFIVALLIFAFYVIQIVASAGWSVVLFRVMEALSVNIKPLGMLMLLFLLASAFGMNHIFPWMHVEGDPILEGKSFWLNIPGWLIRAFIYIFGYFLFRYIIVKKSVEQDNATDYKAHEKGFKYGVMFLAFFFLSESALSWDWIMSLDPHWFSTLFGWYIFASAIVTAITVIALVTIYLKSKGYLEFVNDSHIHDLGKYMFGFSIFWAYLWFAQYMLIWYANMPEETTYFAQRMMQYKFIFFFMVALNFALPVLILMDTAFKRKFAIITIVGIIIIIGHYIDIFVLIMPSTVGANWHFGIPEIGAILFFLGLFIFCTFRDLAKRPLLAKGNPYLKESEHYHY